MCMLTRKAKPEDIDQLALLCEAHAAYEGQSLQFSSAHKQRLTTLLFNDQKLHALVVENQGQLTGYCTFTLQYTTWGATTYLYMDCLYLREEARKRGLGKQLMQQVATFMKTQGIALAQWQTSVENAQGIAFYERLGAQKLSKARFFWEP